jgi:hypothetical protein
LNDNGGIAAHDYLLPGRLPRRSLNLEIELNR